MKIVIIKYNAGNVQSVMYALDRLGANYELTDDEATIRAADKVIFPGVGEASTTMAYLRACGLDRIIPTLTQPVLGTCVGMQLMCQYSHENSTTCMGIFDTEVLRFPETPLFKVPHTGWNNLFEATSPLTKGVKDGAFVYFNHSYYAPIGPDTAAKADYILPFSAVLQRNNFYAAQFHTEISGDVGHQILKNFLEI